jgi:hypothetical protein
MRIWHCRGVASYTKPRDAIRRLDIPADDRDSYRRGDPGNEAGDDRRVVSVRFMLAREAALLRACRRRHSLHFLRMMLLRVLGRLVIHSLFQRLDLVLVLRGGIARQVCVVVW